MTGLKTKNNHFKATNKQFFPQHNKTRLLDRLSYIYWLFMCVCVYYVCYDGEYCCHLIYTVNFKGSAAFADP